MLTIRGVSIFLVVALLCLRPTAASADAQYYASGLLQGMTAAAPGQAMAEPLAVADFFDRTAPRAPGFEWRRLHEQRDATHVHDLYALHVAGRRVVGQFLKLHYNRQGWVQYASSSWRTRFAVPRVGNGEASGARLAARVRSEIARDGGDGARADVRSEPVVWIDESREKGIPALEVRLAYANGESRHFIAEEETGRVLREYPTYRTAEAPNVKVYSVSPLATPTLEAVTLTSLGDLLKLASPYVYVRRVDGNRVKTDVDPQHDYSQVAGPTGFSTDPAKYNADCATAGTTSCPNQGFDGVNVYYHLESFREKLHGYLVTLGVDLATGCAGEKCFPSDPIDVLVNQPSVGSGVNKIDSNNAAYVDDCSSLGFTRCMIFLKPAPIDGASCGGTGTIQIYDLAREANVVVHEFQHYVTDSITRMVRSPVATANVGDALHEGYSDYFGASHIVDTSGNEAATKVLAYGFQECPVVIRDVAVPRAYTNSAADADPHTSGLTWASGLWQLRTSLGRQTADLLALKSQYFMPQAPNFIDAVEALVKADEALNAGANVSTIRSLFYVQLKFLGGKSDLFRDPVNRIAEVGFASCSAVHRSEPGSQAPWLVFAAWLAATVLAGRAVIRGRSA